jgi:hypothetical protein
MKYDNLDRFKKFEYAITGDVDAPDHNYHYSDEIAELLHKTYLKVLKRKPHLIPELLKLVEKYPRIPAFKNYLSQYYNLVGKKEKAYEVNHWLVKEHPDYLHGKINLAAEAIYKKNYDEVPKILGNALDLKDLYPNRKVFHVSEFSAFFSVTCHYLIETNQLEAAESRIEVAKKVLEHDPSIVEGLRNKILQKRLENRQATDRAWKDKHPERIGRSYNKAVQTEEKPIFNHPETWALYEHELTIPTDLLEKILALPRETLLQDLETALKDAVRRYEYFCAMVDDMDEWPENELYFPLHALFLLTELKATDRLPQVLDFLREGEELLEFYLSDHLYETAWHFVYHLGEQQLEVLKAFMLEPNICSEGKTIVLQAVAQVAFHQPERQGEITEWYRDLMQYYLDHLDTPQLVDVDVMAPLIADAANLRDKSLLPLCKQFFDMDMVDESYAGGYEDIKKEMDKPQSEHDKYTIFPSIFDHLNHIVTSWHGYMTPEQQAAKNKEFEERYLQLMNENKGSSNEPQPLPEYSNQWPETVKHDQPNVGRNDPCPCGSGKKYKKCCMGK